MRTPSFSPFVTVREIAALLRVSRWTILEWTRSVDPDAIPCYGRKPLLFKADEVLEWFERTQRRRGAVRVETGRPPPRPSPRRSRGNGVLARRRRRASKGMSDGQGGSGPGMTRVSEDRSAARALAVPSDD